MALTISAALDKIVTVQKSISISSPRAINTRTAFKHPLRPSQKLTGLPAWVNYTSFNQEGRDINLGEEFYAVNMRLYNRSMPDLNAAFDELYALHPVIIETFGLNVILGGAASSTSLRGAEPTFGMAEQGGKTFAVADYILDLVLFNNRAFAAGA